MRSLTVALNDWLPVVKCGEKHRAAHKTAINYITATARADSPVSDLPGVLRQLKVKLAKEGHPAQFNRVRSSVQRFLRDTLGKRHAIYKAAPTSHRSKRRSSERITLRPLPTL